MSRMMSMRELSANSSKVVALAEGGEDVILTRNGKAVARVTREGIHADDARRAEALQRLRDLMRRGIDFGGPATYEERTGR